MTSIAAAVLAASAAAVVAQERHSHHWFDTSPFRPGQRLILNPSRSGRRFRTSRDKLCRPRVRVQLALGAGLCRDVALAAGPWWPFADIAVMSERPTLLRVNALGQLHADDEPTATWPDGSLMWARDGVAIEAS
ncbi:DUF6745 domain-containing protein [Micromonospora inositola]|uniref:DUF6745 domain-containing protein n=1 Tax=Micromonospora inositola TaxID=47865 RepID=UPI0012FE3242|nr:hypothetical protein [Micromonospora inositola]